MRYRLLVILLSLVLGMLSSTLQAQTLTQDTILIDLAGSVMKTETPELKRAQLLYPELYNLQYDCPASDAPKRMPIFCRLEKKMGEIIRYKVKLGVEPQIP